MTKKKIKHRNFFARILRSAQFRPKRIKDKRTKIIEQWIKRHEA